MGLDQYLEDENGVELIYWRKCNQVNRWFNDKVGKVENLEKLKVTKEQLEQLKNDCQTVLEDHSKAEKILPTQQGFFFGSYEYDEYYFNDLEYTVNKIDELFNSEYEITELYYVAWW